MRVGFVEKSKRTGIRYLSLDYIAGHYERFKPESVVTRFLGLLRAVSPFKGLLSYTLPFPSEMVVLARSGKEQS